MNRSLFRTGLITLIFPLLSSGLLAELPEPDSMESHNLAVGVDYCKLEYSNLYGGTQRIYILRIDLSEPTIEVGFGVCPDGIRKNTATLGALYDGIAATNLGFAVVASSPSVPVGLIKAEGKIYSTYSSAGNDPAVGYFWVNGSRAGVATSDKLSLGLGENIRYGYPVLLQRGQIWHAIDPYTGGDPTLVNGIHERTAVGVTSDRQTLYLVVFDRNDSTASPRGVSCRNLADFMQKLGCYEAWNGDGGGSSTMWTKEFGRMNYPSGGTWQRPVHDIVFVRYKQISTPEDSGNPGSPSDHLDTGLTPKKRR